MPRILVIDDDAQIRDVLRQALERVGYEVVCAPDADSATALCEDGKTDLIITDIVMPEKDGMEAIIEFKKNLPGDKDNRNFRWRKDRSIQLFDDGPASRGRQNLHQAP